MSVVSTLYTGQSGLSAHGDAISVVGDNIANVNTVGFKRSRANFEDVLARSLGGGGAGDIGLGTKLSKVQTVLAQGALLGTGMATDLAIKGDGFFALNGNLDGITGNFYSRAGQFKLDQDGYMVNEAGLRVQGYNVDAANALVKNVADVQVSTAQVSPKPTANVSVVGNLDSAVPINPTPAFLTTDPAGTSDFSHSVTVYDSLGKEHTVNIYFRREALSATPNANETWTWHALVDGAEINGGTAGVFEEEASGQLDFDNTGRLIADTPIVASDFDFADAAQDQNITFQFGNPFTGTGTATGMDGMVNYQATSSIGASEQDGYASGSMSGISIGSDGVISAVFTNGLQRTVGQVLLADFQSAQDLQRAGGNMFMETVGSGTALIGEPATAGRGSVNAGSLEQSNVDLTREFVDMIAFQRGFQANSKTVQTADQMMMETLSIKR